ncbi:6-phosphogluconate dehydrogenase [Mycena latifolia]|nr:6-phosphogluconate dehydrogenase [Mycena latifolia]
MRCLLRLPVRFYCLIRLSSQGRNFICNMNDRGISVVAPNRNTFRLDDFLATDAKSTRIRGAYSIAALAAQLRTPRIVFLMLKPGAAIDNFIFMLKPLLEPEDVIVELADSHSLDTARRTRELKRSGLLFVGCGLGGGQDGVRTGPCSKNVLQRSAAQVHGQPCCDWVGVGGAGHFVKMVQTGLLYSDMELLAEAYDLLRRILGFTEDEVAEVFALWTGGVLGSVLLDATTDILRLKDDDGEPLVLKILDRAGQKGVGKAAVVEALEHGASLSVTTQAVFSRCLSTLKMERSRASRLFSGPEMGAFSGDRQAFVDDLEQTLYASKIVSYAQVFKLLAATNETNKWGFKYRSIAHIWRGGCLIAGNILTLIVDAYTRAPQKSLILDDFFRQALQKAQPAWRRTVSHAVLRGVPIPAFSAALAFFDGYRSAVLPANLIQAQREYFGAHGLDVPRREHEINWRAYGNALGAFK